MVWRAWCWWRAVRPFGGGALLPLLPVALALLGITLGSLYQKRFCGQMNMVTGTVLQYVTAGAAFAAMAYGLETRRIDWTGGFVFALLWLALVLRNGQAARVASLFYLTPGATAIMAWLLFGETLTPLALTGFALTGVGVVLARRG